MTINRSNYEEYFLLYTDNELNEVERRTVEAFVEANPDLAGELVMLQQSTFQPDKNVVFQKKESIMKMEAVEGFIHRGNCEQMFVLYADDEMNKTEKIEVERFVYYHPEYQEAFELIQKLKLTPDYNVVFPKKESLFRYERNSKVTIPWRGMAAAAVVLIFAGLLWFNNQGPEVSPTLTAEVKSNTSPKSSRIEPDEKVKPNTPDEDSYTVVKPGGDPAIKRLAPPADTKKPVQASAEKFLTQNSKTEKSGETLRGSRSRNTPARNHSGEDVVTHKIPEGSDVSSNTIKGIPNKTQKIIIDEPSIKNIDDNSASYQNTILLTAGNNTENLTLSEFPEEDKSPLRGLLRKATRLIDKNTQSRSSKRPTLSIGNIEIAFQ